MAVGTGPGFTTGLAAGCVVTGEGVTGAEVVVAVVGTGAAVGPPLLAAGLKAGFCENRAG